MFPIIIDFRSSNLFGRELIFRFPKIILSLNLVFNEKSVSMVCSEFCSDELFEKCSLLDDPEPCFEVSM